MNQQAAHLVTPLPHVPGMFSLAGQVAIVTGAGKGIGRACAIALAQAGADVALAARTGADLEEVAHIIRALGRRAICLPGDVNEAGARAALVEQTVAQLGRITILVNNAGGAGPNDPLVMAPDVFAAVLNWNVVPAYAMIQLVAAPMRAAGGGSVINISSVAARLAQPRFSAYGAAKAALNQMTRNLAQDYAPHVRINAIEPGAIRTEALARYLTEEREQALLRATPMGALGLPEDIAAAVLYLASPAARWITGKILAVDGGAEAPAQS